MHTNETRFLLLAASLHGKKWRALSLKGDYSTGCGIELPVGQGLAPCWELMQWLWMSLLMMDKINLLWCICTWWKLQKSGPKQGRLLVVESDKKLLSFCSTLCQRPLEELELYITPSACFQLLSGVFLPGKAQPHTPSLKLLIHLRFCVSPP